LSKLRTTTARSPAVVPEGLLIESVYVLPEMAMLVSAEPDPLARTPIAIGYLTTIV
jgi:hypothetical protein